MEHNLMLIDGNSLDQQLESINKWCHSEVVPMQHRGKPTNIILIWQRAKDMGIEPFTAMEELFVVHGRVGCSTKLMLAMIRKKCPQAYIKIADGKDGGAYAASCTMARSREESDMECAFTSVWTMERAATMGLVQREQWIKQPRTMLRWRAVAEAARLIFGDIILFYTPDELQDFNETVAAEKDDIQPNLFDDIPTTAKVVDQPESPRKSDCEKLKMKLAQVPDPSAATLKLYEITKLKEWNFQELEKLPQKTIDFLTDKL